MTRAPLVDQSVVVPQTKPTAAAVDVSPQAEIAGHLAAIDATISKIQLLLEILRERQRRVEELLAGRG